MKVTIELSDNWLQKVATAASDEGSNDHEHELLMGIAEEISREVGFDLWAEVERINDKFYSEADSS